MIIGLVIGGVFLLLLAAIVGAVLVYLRRAKPDPNGKDALGKVRIYCETVELILCVSSSHD